MLLDPVPLFSRWKTDTVERPLSGVFGRRSGNFQPPGDPTRRKGGLVGAALLYAGTWMIRLAHRQPHLAPPNQKSSHVGFLACAGF